MRAKESIEQASSLPNRKPVEKPAAQSDGQITSSPDVQSDKIDMKRMLFMYFFEKRKQAEIARHFNCARQSINIALKPFRKLFENPESVIVYRDNKGEVLEAIEMVLAMNLTNKQKLKKASLNNMAYAFDKVHQAGLLVAGKPTGRIDHTQDFSKMEDREVIKNFNILIRGMNIFAPK